MIQLTYADVLELLGYTKSPRHPLEILGYEFSTEGAARFRRERPDYAPQVCGVIEDALRETGSFPHPGDRGEEAVYIERQGREYLLHTWVEIAVGRMVRKAIKFRSVADAARALVSETANPDYVKA